MKKILLLIILIAASAEARQLPKNIEFLWDANNPDDGVNYYSLVVNGSSYTIQSSSCAPDINNNNIQTCHQLYTINNLGTYNVNLTATNEFGTSLPASLIFTVNIPGRSNNLRIRIL